MTIFAGSRVTADALDQLVPLSAVKGSDQSYSGTTLTNDTELFVAVDANTTYIINCCLIYEGGSNGNSDMKFQFAQPGGSSLAVAVNAYLFTDNTIHGAASIAGTSTFIVGTSTAGSKRGLMMSGSITVGNSNGTLQIKAAQNTSSSTLTIIHAQSYLALQLVG